MKNQNNTETTRRKNETASDIELAIIFFVFVAMAFAAGYYTAAAQLAAMLDS